MDIEQEREWMQRCARQLVVMMGQVHDLQVTLSNVENEIKEHHLALTEELNDAKENNNGN